MEYIGFDRNDQSQKKFIYDTSKVLTSNPPKYEVRYEDTNEIGYIECSSVFALKPVKPMRPNIRKVQKIEEKKEEVLVPVEDTINLDGVPEDIQQAIQDELKPKKKTSKQVSADKEPKKKTSAAKATKTSKLAKKVSDITDEEGNMLIPTAAADSYPNDYTLAGFVLNHKYEYKTILDDLEGIEEKLNELGEDKWELVNFEVIQNLMKSPRLFCILKRNKTN